MATRVDCTILDRQLCGNGLLALTFHGWEYGSSELSRVILSYVSLSNDETITVQTRLHLHGSKSWVYSDGYFVGRIRKALILIAADGSHERVIPTMSNPSFVIHNQEIYICHRKKYHKNVITQIPLSGRETTTIITNLPVNCRLLRITESEMVFYHQGTIVVKSYGVSLVNLVGSDQINSKYDRQEPLISQRRLTRGLGSLCEFDRRGRRDYNCFTVTVNDHGTIAIGTKDYIELFNSEGQAINYRLIPHHKHPIQLAPFEDSFIYLINDQVMRI